MNPPKESEFLKRVPRPYRGGVVEDFFFLPIAEARAAELLTTLDAKEQGHFYMVLAHSMTVMARVTIHSSEVFDDGRARERWRWMNEMMHGATLQIKAVSGVGAEPAFSPEQFCRSMFEKARAGGFEDEFSANCVAHALWLHLKPADSENAWPVPPSSPS